MDGRLQVAEHPAIPRPAGKRGHETEDSPFTFDTAISLTAFHNVCVAAP